MLNLSFRPIDIGLDIGLWLGFLFTGWRLSCASKVMTRDTKGTPSYLQWNHRPPTCGQNQEFTDYVELKNQEKGGF